MKETDSVRQEEEKEEGKQQQNNEKSKEQSKEEEEKKAGDGFGGNLDINTNIQREKKNLDGANDRTNSGDVRTQHYLDSLLRRNDVNLQERLEKAIGDYFDVNRQYPDANYTTLIVFITDWLDLIDVPPNDLRNLMHRMKELREKDDDAETEYKVAFNRAGMMQQVNHGAGGFLDEMVPINEEDYFWGT